MLLMLIYFNSNYLSQSIKNYYSLPKNQTAENLSPNIKSCKTKDIPLKFLCRLFNLIDEQDYIEKKNNDYILPPGSYAKIIRYIYVLLVLLGYLILKLVPEDYKYREKIILIYIIVIFCCRTLYQETISKYSSNSEPYINCILDDDDRNPQIYSSYPSKKLTFR